MVKKDTKKKIAIGAAAAVAGGAAAMAHPKIRKGAEKMGKESLDKAKDMKDDIQEKL